MTSPTETVAPARPRVLFSFTRPAPEANPYTTLLAQLVDGSVDVVGAEAQRLVAGVVLPDAR